MKKNQQNKTRSYLIFLVNSCSHSCKSNDRSMRKYFSVFMKKIYQKPKHGSNMVPVLSSRNFDDLQLCKITDDLCRQFANYLTEAIHLHNSPNNKKQKYQAALGYFSSFKVLNVINFSGRNTLLRCLAVDHWSLYCQRIRKRRIGRQTKLEQVYLDPMRVLLQKISKQCHLLPFGLVL